MKKRKLHDTYEEPCTYTVSDETTMERMNPTFLLKFESICKKTHHYFRFLEFSTYKFSSW